MNRLKALAQACASSALFWVFALLAGMVGFILYYEKPVNFVVNNNYKLF